MKLIGLISDTHGYLDPRFTKHLKKCDEIWHAGDIGKIEVIEKLEEIAKVKSVYGNIDNHEIRLRYKKYLEFSCEEINVLITHIGGFPGKYVKEVEVIIKNKPPNLFICGHSHILRVINDKKLGLLHINPGAAGNTGIHKVKTIIIFNINVDKISNLKVIQLQRK
tara:strand:+ start:17 stop:511 length:495 start_codon:yes stop_codon:yes gene_type:complete